MRFYFTTGTIGKIALVLTLAVLPLTLSATALAENGNAKLCTKSWSTVQNGSGGSFSTAVPARPTT